MNTILEIIQTEFFFIYIIYKFTNFRITYKFYLYIVLGLTFVLIAHEFYKYEFISVILVLFVQLITPIVGIKHNSIKKLLYINLCCSSFVSLIYSVILFTSGLIKNQISTNRVTEHFVCFIVILAIILLLKNKSVSNIIFEIDLMSKKIKIIILVFIFGLDSVIISLSTIFRLKISFSYKIAITFIFFLTILVSLAIILLLVSESLSNSYYSKYNKIMEEKISNDAKHIEKITLATEDLRHLKHDAKNMILGINAYLDSNDIEGAKEYLENFSARIEPSKNRINTGNPFLDSLISDKSDKLNNNNIHIVFNGLMPTESLNPIDICIVFGNALDNAIEACEKLSQESVKIIEISIKQHANVLFVSISNPISHPVKINNNMVISTKSSIGHGIGINSMRKIVTNYNGQLVLKSDETKFTVEMSFVLDLAEITI